MAALRQLRARPLFAVATAAVLALGFGPSLAAFAIADSVFLAPLPYEHADRLVNAWHTDSGTTVTVSGADYLDWNRDAPLFAGMAAVSARGFNLAGGDRPERIEGAVVSAGFFSVMEVPPLLGRWFTAGTRAALLSERLWRTRFGGDRSIIGGTVSLDGEPISVIGVMPERFRYPPGAEIWVSARSQVPEHPTYPIDPDHDRSRQYLTVVARLAPGASIAQAQAALQVTQARLAKEYPDDDGSFGAALVPLRETLTGKARPELLVLAVVAALLLAVAWVNAAHLFLARAVERSHEVAVRVALGASRRALWRLWFTEALALAGAAALLGLGIAIWGGPALVAASPHARSLPLPSTGGRTLVATAALWLIAGGSLGVVAALQPIRAAEALQEGGRTGTGGRRPRRLRAAFLIFEVALSLALLLGAGLLVRSFMALLRVDPGFVAEGVLAADLPLPRARYPDKAAQARFAIEALRRLRADPQIEAAGFVSRLPLSPSNTVGAITVPGRERDAFPADMRVASAGYFEALRIPLRAGRAFTDEDARDAPPVAIVNETAARRAFPGESALGKRIVIWADKAPAEIVGVVGDVRHTGLDAAPRPEAYRPLGTEPWPNLALVARGRVGAAALVAPVQQAIWSLDREQPIVRPEPMQARLSASLALRQFTLELISAAAAAALLLAAAGIYGVTAYLVAQRTRELGVRMALGATPRRLVRQLLAENLKLVAAGCALGLCAGAGLSRLLRGLLYGVPALDPLTFALLPLLLAAAAALATLLAASRAARIDPAEALRAS